VTNIRVSHASGVPIYRQIVEQVEFMIEDGQLNDGDRLPSSRMLGENLSINRNTVARAYQELRDRGFVESRRRLGMVVVGSRQARDRASARDRARSILEEATRECVGLGLSADEISSLAYHFGLRAGELEVKLVFVECNEERAGYFAKELSEQLDVAVKPLVLGSFDPDDAFDADLVLTTFFHLSEVRKLARGTTAEVVAIVVAPHMQTLVQLSKVPKGHRIGILYSTRDQAELIRSSLMQAGLTDIQVLGADVNGGSPPVDVVVVPTEMPELRKSIQGDVQVIEFGNVLDEPSIRMVREVVADAQDSKALATHPV
jgi:GntR family transcriptional regulator